MSADFDLEGRVALVTGASGALGSAIAETFDAAGATVCGADIVAPEEDDALVDPEAIEFYRGDLTEEGDVEQVIEEVVDDHGRLDFLANIAGTWRGGDPIAETDVETFQFLFKACN